MIIKEFDFPIYGIMIIVSVIAGIAYIFYNLRKELNKQQLIQYSSLFLAFATVGSIGIYSLFGGKVGFTSYAGLVSVIVCAIIYNLIEPKNNIYLKYSIISAPLIYSIGKIGCFLAGCCYGASYSGLLSVTYAADIHHSYFPIQLVESLVFFSLFLMLDLLKNNKYITELTLLICAIFKFLLEYLRYDMRIDEMFIFLFPNQIFSLIVIVVSIGLIIFRNFKKI